MQKIVTAMPTLKRPEMLALSLEKLQAAKQHSPDLDVSDVRIFLDHSNNSKNDVHLDETEYVRDTYFPTAEIFQAKNHPLTPGGCWNILQALKSGYETGADFVCLVEEDVLVRPDFFQKHLEMQASGDYFVTSGRTLPHLGPEYYTNPGCCFRRDKLAHVIPHICDAYFADLTGYLERHFPLMDDAGVLDDGLIRRVMRSVNGKARSAVPAIVSHIGFHYYNKMAQYRTEGLIADRIAQLRVILERVDTKDKYTSDFEPF